MSKFIGPQYSVGIGKEATRGTAVAATYWVPWTSLTIDDKIKSAKDETSIGVIESGVGQEVTMYTSQCQLEGNIDDAGFGLILKSLMGGEAAVQLVGDTTVYDHNFTVSQSAQHPALSISVYGPNEGSGLVYPLSMLESLDLTFELDKYSTFKATYKSNKNTTQSNTVAFVTANKFRPQDGVFNYSPRLTGLLKTISGTGTASSSIHVTSSSISTDLLKVGQTVIGANVPAGTTIVTIVSATAFDLSQATTGALGTFVVGSLGATGTAATTTAVTALSINTNLIQVGMTVTGVNVPVGATVAAIVSASAFTLSAATTGNMAAIMFGPVATNIKKFQVSFKKNTEDDEVIGNTSPVDRYNKAFMCSGSFEIYYDSRYLIDTVMLGDIYEAIAITMVNSNVTIGSAANPTFIFRAARTKLTEVARKFSDKDITMATFKFECFYSLADAEMLDITLRNLVSAVY